MHGISRLPAIRRNHDSRTDNARAACAGVCNSRRPSPCSGNSGAIPSRSIAVARHPVHHDRLPLLAAAASQHQRHRAAINTEIQALQQQLADAHAHIQTLEATAAQLKAKITTLCAVITELIHETTANNVLAMPSGRHRDA